MLVSGTGQSVITFLAFHVLRRFDRFTVQWPDEPWWKRESNVQAPLISRRRVTYKLKGIRAGLGYLLIYTVQAD